MKESIIIEKSTQYLCSDVSKEYMIETSAQYHLLELNVKHHPIVDPLMQCEKTTHDRAPSTRDVNIYSMIE